MKKQKRSESVALEGRLETWTPPSSGNDFQSWDGKVRATWQSAKPEPTYRVVMESSAKNYNAYGSFVRDLFVWTETEIATGLPRAKAIELAALLLNSPKYNRATLVEEEDVGQWIEVKDEGVKQSDAG